MKKTQRTLRREDTTKTEVLHLAFELSQNKWKLGFSDGNRMRFKSIVARNLKQLQEEIEKAKEKFKLKADVRTTFWHILSLGRGYLFKMSKVRTG